MRPYNTENIGTNPNSIAALHKHRGTGTKVVMNHIHMLNLITALESGTLSMQELADETGLSYVTIRKFCTAAHRKKMIHICCWENDAKGRNLVIIYKWGKGTDVKRIKFSAAERQARTRMKKKNLQLRKELSFLVPAMNSEFNSAT